MDTNIAEISDITDIDLSPGVIQKFFWMNYRINCFTLA